MTTNQTIDGVPRELLESFAAYVADSPNAVMRSRAAQLRALLDGPAKPAECLEADNVKLAADRAALSAELETLRKSYRNVLVLLEAAQPQGEPVAWIGCKHKLPDEGEHVLVKYATLEGLEIVHGAKRHKLFDDMDHLFWVNDRGESMRGEVSAWIPMSRLLGIPAEQPAPVAVVLPGTADHKSGDRANPAYLQDPCFADGWNACLDELKRLNPSL